MKKINLLVLLASVLLLTSCINPGAKDTPLSPDNNQNTPPPVGSTASAMASVIQPTVFSEETTAALSTFGDDALFFDYTAEETLQTITITLWMYEEGQWVSKGDLSGTADSRGRIAFRLTETGLDFVAFISGGRASSNIPVIYPTLPETVMHAMYRLNNQTEIVPGTEIPLWVKVSTEENGISVNGDFRSLNCAAGIAVTATFSNKQPD